MSFGMLVTMLGLVGICLRVSAVCFVCRASVGATTERQAAADQRCSAVESLATKILGRAYQRDRWLKVDG